MKVAVIHPYRETVHQFWKEYFFMPERGVQMATYLDNVGKDVDFIDFGQTTTEDEHTFNVEIPKELKGTVNEMIHYGWPEEKIESWFDDHGDEYTHYVVDALTPYFYPGVNFVRDQIERFDKPLVFFGEWPQLRPDDFQDYPAVADNWEAGVECWLDGINLGDSNPPEKEMGPGVHHYSFDDYPMDTLPAPNWKKFTDPEGYPEPHCADIRFSRGCVERCDFCHVAGMYDGRFNFKRPEVIKQDIADLVDRQGYEKIKIRDDNFCAATDTAKEVFQWIAENYPDVEIMQVEGMEMRTASRDKELIDAIGECNYHSVRVGFETAIDGTFSKNNLEWWETAHDYFTDAGFEAEDIKTFVIRGHPKLKRTDEIHTAIYLSQFDVSLVSGGYRLVPGTELWDDYVEEHDDTPPYEYGFGLPTDDDEIDDVGRLYRTVTYWNQWGIDLFHSENPLSEFADLSWVDQVEDTGDDITVKGTVSGWRRTDGIRYGLSYILASRGFYRHSVETDTKEVMKIRGYKGSDDFVEKVMDCASERGIDVSDPPGGLL